MASNLVRVPPVADRIARLGFRLSASECQTIGGQLIFGFRFPRPAYQGFLRVRGEDWEAFLPLATC